jgi:MFS family permease
MTAYSTTPDTNSDPVRMTPLELRASTSLAAIFGLRLLGMFIILPVFALYASTLPGWDRIWIGIALGIYGLTQAMLQIPFGWVSDRIGRKPVMYAGLILFAVGSFVCAASTSVGGIVLGRILQGGGAISSVALAMAADLTRDSQRTKAMAIIGMTIGLAFALSFVVSPFLAATVGVPGIFALTGVLALSAIGVVAFIVPDVPHPKAMERVRFMAVLTNPALARLNLGIFAIHAILMAMFVVVPFSLAAAGLAARDHWMLYLGVFGASVVLMIPAVRSRKADSRSHSIFLGAIGMLTVGLALLALLQNSLWGLALALLVFFTAFNILEAKLPALVSQRAPPSAKGSATGVYSSVQFLGTFAGGALGGVISQHFGGATVLWFCVALAALWWLVALSGE